MTQPQPSRPVGPRQGFVAVGDELAAWLAGQVRDRLHHSASNGEPQTRVVEQAIRQSLDRHAQARMQAGQPPPDRAIEAYAAARVRERLWGLGGLQRLLDDPDVEDITVNGADIVHVRYTDGRRERVAPVAGSDEELVELIRSIVARAGHEERRLDAAHPYVCVALSDGSRLAAIMTVTKRPSLAIRRFPVRFATLDQLRELGTIDGAVQKFLVAAMRARLTSVISGGTATGKTTLLRALATEIPAHERLVTIEDSLELGLDHDRQAHPDALALQAREPNVEGHGEIDLAELVRFSLRLSPDRVIVGEVRGDEAVPMLMAASQGNDGTLATIHASSSRGALRRLATYAALSEQRLDIPAANLLIAGAIHFVVHLAWQGNRRVVASIREVLDADGHQIATNEIFAPGRDGRAAPAAPLRVSTLEHLADAGFDPALFHDSPLA